jgi:hypothetical protein
LNGRRRPGALARALVAAAAIVAAGAFGCGGGGGGTSPPPPPPPPPTGVTFTTATGTGATVVALRAVTQTTAQLVLEVRAESVTGLYGVAFDLSYPANLFRLVSQTEGSFLSQTGADATTFQLSEPAPGMLVAGASRLGPLTGVSGSGPLATLVFTPIASGTGMFTLSRTQAFAADGTVISSVQWLGGSAVVNL